MAAVDEVVKKIDECISNAKAIFDDQFQTLKASQERESGPVAFSSGTKLTQQCIVCGKEIVDYAIFGRWIEGEPEGQVNINWKCRTCGKPYIFRGPRASIIHQLLHRSYQPRAA